MPRIKLLKKIIYLYIGIIVIISSLNIFFLAGAYSSNPTYDQPYNIHLNWQHDPTTTITIIWETTISTTGSIVKYGLDTNYSQIATGVIDNQGTNGLIHIVEITGLSKNTTYHYICGENAGGWSIDSTFKTAPTDPVDFSICCMGDSRDNPTEFNKIVSKANAFNPTFTIFSGDLCGSDNKNAYDIWFSDWEQLGNHCPIAPALGNHEGNAINYLHRFALPNNERWYSFNYSNIHIIVLSTTLDKYAQGTTQYSWFVNDLQASMNDPLHQWKIVTFHNPPYNVGGHGGDSNIQKILSPLISQFKVDLVINGHNHYYERTYPLKGGGANPTVTDTNLSYYKNPNGVIYATVGSCGAPLYNTGSAYYIAAAVKNYQYAKISVLTNNTLHMETFLDDGTTLIDDFWIEKNTEPNLQPDTPTIKGPTQGKVRVNIKYNFVTTDPNDDDIYYFIDWGDHVNSSWIGPFHSGDEITQPHIWTKNGTYIIKAKAKDVYGNESDWAEFETKISSPRDKVIINHYWQRFLERLLLLWR